MSEYLQLKTLQSLSVLDKAYFFYKINILTNMDTILSTPDSNLNPYMHMQQMLPIPLVPQQNGTHVNQHAIYMPKYNHQHQTNGHELNKQHQNFINNSQNHLPDNSEAQVPVTTVMIPATAAAQLQNASQQIQQATMQAMLNSNQPPQPQILVLMIPYQMPQTTTVMNGPSTLNNLDTQSRFSTLNRQAHSISVASSLSESYSRTMSSLSVAKQETEKFYIKTNFNYASKNKNEISFRKGDILQVTDTFANIEDELNSWFATRIGQDGHLEKGLIPNQSKAEKIIYAQQMFEAQADQKSLNGETMTASDVLSSSVSKVNFLKRKSPRRSKSFSKESWDNIVFEMGNNKISPYERVAFKHPGFCRPVVIFGPLADIARDKLLKDYPEKYSYPSGLNRNQIVNYPTVIRLKNIQEIIEQGKFALLDITPSAVEKLNHINLCPIVVFMKAEKQIVKEFRYRAIKSLNESEEITQRFECESSKKLIEQATKLEKFWSHVFTATLNLSAMGSEMWYRKLRETIESQQASSIWMCERKMDKRYQKLYEYELDK